MRTLLIALWASFCFANPLPSLEEFAPKPLRKLPNITPHALSTCTDFTGNWKGTCTDGKTKIPSQLSIKQLGCHVLIMNSKEFPIKGALVEERKGPPSTVGGVNPQSYSLTQTNQFYWDRAQLNLKVFVNAVGLTLDAGRSFHSLANIVGTWKLEGAELVTESKLTGFVDDVGITYQTLSTQRDCRYTL